LATGVAGEAAGFSAGPTGLNERGLVGAASVRAHGTVTPVANGLSMGFMVVGTG
jgi:hypothetical protein